MNSNFSADLEYNNLFHMVATGENVPEEINIIVEIFKGSRVKYEYNKKAGAVMVDRILHTPIPYPFSYGLIPQTWNDYDHDPLDAIIICKEELLPECIVPCRTIGMLSVDDTGERVVIGPVIIMQGSCDEIGGLDTGFIL